MRRILFIIIIILFSSPLFSSEYLLFASYFDETRASAFKMDGEGNLSHVLDFSVGKDSQYVATSPNGQFVIVSSEYDEYALTFLFLDKYGNITTSGTISKANSYPVAFSRDWPFMYVGFYPCNIFGIDYVDRKIYDTKVCYDLKTSPLEIGYSSYCKNIVYNSYMAINDIGVTYDGNFTTSTHQVSFSGGTNSDFAISPDGRWAAITGIAMPWDPDLSVVGIAKDGSLSLIEQWILPPYDECTNPEKLRYTPDGKYLILMDEGPHDLICFKVDQDTGKLTKISYTETPHEPPWTAPQAMAITPDSQYIVVMEINPPGSDTTLRVVRIEEDGKLTILADKYLVINGFPSDMDFVPFWRETLAPPHGWLAH